MAPVLAAAATASRPASLRTNFSWTFVGNVSYAGCQWGMLSVLAKLGSAEMVGQYALGLAVTAPVMMLCNLQLRGVLATDANEDHRFSDYLLVRLATSGAALFIIAAIVWLSRYSKPTALVILGIAVAKTFESISDISYGYLQHRERMDRIAHSMIVRGAIGVVALWIGVRLSGNVLPGVVGMAAGWGVLLVAFDLRGLKREVTELPGLLFMLHGATRRRQSLGRLIVLAAPLGIVMMFASLNGNLPRYAVQYYAGERSLGVFAAVAYMMVAGTTVIAALGQSASPRLAHYYASGQVRRFRALMGKLLLVGATLGVCGIAVAVTMGAVILRVLFRPEYAASADVLSWMMAAAAISYLASFLGFGLTAARRFSVQAVLFTLVCAVVAVASFALVPRYGLVGAAWATSLGAVVQLVAAATILHRATRTTGEVITREI